MSKRTNVTLWTLQTILALLFLAVGIMKLAMPVDQLGKVTHLNGEFMKLVGVLETLGGLGLILPELTHIFSGLTPLAACGLVGIMIGAVTVSVINLGAAAAILPLVVGIIAAFIARQRWYLVHSFAA